MFIIIAGPTGAGKSEVAVEVARKINGEVVSADSMQVYEGMDIGTYKIKEEEKKGIPHHMISIITPDLDFSVAQYKKQAEKTMKAVSKSGKVPVLAGGTGLYIHAIIKGLFDSKETDPRLKEHLEHVMDEKGLEQIDSEDDLSKIIDKVIADNPDQVAEYKAGKEPVLKYLLGMVMREAKGQANPQKTEEMLKNKLK